MRKPILTLKLLTLSLLGIAALPTNVPAADREPVFFDAPAPETLADILFPPRYRGIDAHDTPPAKDPVFGMMIHFKFDSTEITPPSKKLLASVGEMMGMPNVGQRAIVIEGHTDAIGSGAYNQRLSERRAGAIKQYLVSNFGIAPKRLLTVGRGERELYKKDDPRAGINRRATFRPARKLVLK